MVFFMAEASRLNKAKITEQITKSERKKLAAEFEKQEAIRLEAKKKEEKKEIERVERENRRAELHGKISVVKNEALKEKIKASHSYAKSESLRVTVSISLVIIFISYWFVFR